MIPIEKNKVTLRGRGRRRGRIAMAANRTDPGWVTRKSKKEVLIENLVFLVNNMIKAQYIIRKFL